MTPASIARMADYNRWMNLRLYDAAARLTEAQLFEDRGAFFGSLFETLNHIAVADTIWLHRFAKHDGLGGLAERTKDLPQPTSLRQRLTPSLADTGFNAIAVGSVAGLLVVAGTVLVAARRRKATSR